MFLLIDIILGIIACLLIIYLLLSFDQIMNGMLKMWIFRVACFSFLKFICFLILLDKIVIICYVYCLWSWYVGWCSYAWRSLDVCYLMEMVALSILSKRTFYLVSIWAFYFIIHRISMLIILWMSLLIILRMFLLIICRMFLLIICRMFWLIICRMPLLIIIRVFNLSICRTFNLINLWISKKILSIIQLNSLNITISLRVHRIYCTGFYIINVLIYFVKFYTRTYSTTYIRSTRIPNALIGRTLCWQLFFRFMLLLL